MYVKATLQLSISKVQGSRMFARGIANPGMVFMVF